MTADPIPYGKLARRGVPLIDGIEKVTGRAKYTADLDHANALVGRLLRSPVSHGDIVRLDLTKARALDGVVAIVTGTDCAHTYGVLPIAMNEYPLARGRVRYRGEPIAAVAAIDEETAERALGLIELEVLVKRAFDRGFIDRHWLGFEDFQADVERAARHPEMARDPQGDEFTLFGDTAEELSRWYGFSDEGRADRERLLQEIDAKVATTEPHHNPFRGIGRNDPCPCGSGKKFKRCCLGLTAAMT